MEDLLEGMNYENLRSRHFEFCAPCFILSALTLVLPSQAEPFGIGFPQFDPHQSVITSEDLLPMFVRKATTAPLANSVVASSAVGTRREVRVSDALSVSADYSQWSYRIPRGVKFSNGEQILPADVVFSLDRCAAQSNPNGYRTSSARAESNPPTLWVQITVVPQGAEGAKNFAAWISECPILQKRSTQLFGEEFGVGSNMVSVGPYAVSSFVSGKKFILDRIRTNSRDRVGVDQFELRAFQSGDQGLAALRIGTIHGFATNELAIVERARFDETLLLDKCDQYWMIRRKSATVGCVESLSVLDIGDQT